MLLRRKTAQKAESFNFIQQSFWFINYKSKSKNSLQTYKKKLFSHIITTSKKLSN